VHKEIEELDEVDDFFTRNYKYYENLYLKQGKNLNYSSKCEAERITPKKNNQSTIKTNEDSEIKNFTFKVGEDVTKKINDILLTEEKLDLARTLEKKEQHDYKERVLFYMIKLRLEYDAILKRKEKEIEEKSKEEVEMKIAKIKEDYRKNYEILKQELKGKMREEKEQKLYKNMYIKLKPVVEAEIYKNEFGKIEEKIKNQIEKRLETEFKEKKQNEIEKLRKKYELMNKNKLEEIETKIKEKCKEEYEVLLKIEIEKKEKEIKAFYIKKYENYKSKIEKQLDERYSLKEKELFHHVNEIKTKFFRQKCAENIKLNNFVQLKEKLNIDNVTSQPKVISKSRSLVTLMEGKSSFADDLNNKFDVSNITDVNGTNLSNNPYSIKLLNTILTEEKVPIEEKKNNLFTNNSKLCTIKETNRECKFNTKQSLRFN